jgi:hypothetical protein
MSYQELQNVATVANRIAPPCYYRVAQDEFNERLGQVTTGFGLVALVAIYILLAVVK